MDTSLDSKCVLILSEILKTNKTIKTLRLQSSSLTGGIKQVSDSLFNNKKLETLVLSYVTGITDENMTHLSTMLASNTTLKSYVSPTVTSLIMESNISVKGLLKTKH